MRTSSTAQELTDDLVSFERVSADCRYGTPPGDCRPGIDLAAGLSGLFRFTDGTVRRIKRVGVAGALLLNSPRHSQVSMLKGNADWPEVETPDPHVRGPRPA
jgi:hypothetical protein